MVCPLLVKEGKKYECNSGWIFSDDGRPDEFCPTDLRCVYGDRVWMYSGSYSGFGCYLDDSVHLYNDTGTGTYLINRYLCRRNFRWVNHGDTD